MGRHVSSRGVCCLSPGEIHTDLMCAMCVVCVPCVCVVCLSPGEIHADLMRRYAPPQQMVAQYGALSLQELSVPEMTSVRVGALQ